MKEFIAKLLSSDFMPHGYCYLWKPGLIWLHAVSDILIALAYFSIPVTLFYFIRRRRDLPFNWIFLCFGMFILACGSTHLMEVWTLWHGTYWLSGAVKLITAGVSVPTAIVLAQLVPVALRLPSREALELEIREREFAETQLRIAKNELERRVQERTAELQRSNDSLLAEIVQRKEIEKELRASEERFRLLVEGVEDYAIYSLNPSGCVSSWNAGAQRIKGYTEEEIVGKHISRFYPPEDAVGKAELALQIASTEGRFVEEGWRMRKDGSPFWASVVMTTMRDKRGELIGFSKITRDLTERKHAEETLRLSEEQRRLAQDASGLGIWDWNILTDSTTWSDEHFRIFGLQPGNRRLNWATVLVLVHPDDRSMVQAAVRDALRPGGQLEVEYRTQCPNGEIRWVISKGQTHCNDGGTPIRMIGVTMDATIRKELEEAQAQLSRLSRVLTMGELTSSIAHEVNQPLAAVVANANACLRWMGAERPNLERARESVAAIITESHRASAVIQRVRALAKMTAPEKISLSVNEVIEEVVGLASADLSRNHVALRTELALELPSAFGDRVQLQQVILNLILNGIEAMRLVVDRAKELAICSILSTEGTVTIRVRDCGSGLPPEASSRLFQAFFTTKKEGMGLGLSISRSIVEAHGGRLWATPNTDHGATFQFTLPRFAEASA
jgi:PAS domain S-box-containing protein